MKKVFSIALVVILSLGLFILTGCNNNEGETKEKVSGGWETVLTSKEVEMSEEAKKAFEKASNNYKDMKFNLVALLGEQVVAGKNYMYLVKGFKEGKETEATYKIVIIYNDLENNAKITSVSDFDYTKYVNKNIENKNEQLAGGWTVNSLGKTGTLEEADQKIFNDATATLTGVNYRPIAVLGTQLVAGTNYAVICYGSASYENSPESIYVLTIYEDINGKREVAYQAYVDISEYNK